MHQIQEKSTNIIAKEDGLVLKPGLRRQANSTSCVATDGAVNAAAAATGCKLYTVILGERRAQQAGVFRR